MDSTAINENLKLVPSSPNFFIPVQDRQVEPQKQQLLLAPSASSSGKKRKLMEDGDDDARSNSSHQQLDSNNNISKHRRLSHQKSNNLTIALVENSSERFIPSSAGNAEGIIVISMATTAPMLDAAAVSTRRDAVAVIKNCPETVRLIDSTPPFINGSMKTYQIEGLNWLIDHHKNGTNAILADEMGLGKTLQVISMLGYLKNEQNKINGSCPSFLVVTPLVTLNNWETELKRWCPSLRVVVFHGNQYERTKQFSDMKKHLNKWDVCLTTQDTMRADHLKLKTIDWNYLVIDEAHTIKSLTTKLSEAVRSLKADHRLLVTGTPVNNNCKELWSLANFIEPIKFDKVEDFIRESDESLRAKLKPHLLRRLKSDYASDLLEKEMNIVMIERTDYQKQVLHTQQQIFASSSKADLEINKITFERQLTSHPNLVDGIYRRTMAMEQIIESSGKMKYLDALLPQLKANESNVLIFSQFMQMLDILQFYCRQKGYPCCRLDGSVIGDDRAKQVNRYKRSVQLTFKIFLMTTKAGGVGINLTEADSVILYDSDWNPQTDKQAMDRAHRIGQTKQVRVYRLVTEGTVEEAMMKKAQFKLDLADRLLLPSKSNADDDKEKLSVVTATADDGAAVASTSATGIKRKRDNDDEAFPVLPEAKKNRIKNKRVASSDKEVEEDERRFFKAFSDSTSKTLSKSELEKLAEMSKAKINDLTSKFCEKVNPSSQRSKLRLKPISAAVTIKHDSIGAAVNTQQKTSIEKPSKAAASSDHINSKVALAAIKSSGIKLDSSKIMVAVQKNQQATNPDLLGSIFDAQKKLFDKRDDSASPGAEPPSAFVAKNCPIVSVTVTQPKSAAIKTPNAVAADFLHQKVDSSASLNKLTPLKTIKRPIVVEEVEISVPFEGEEAKRIQHQRHQEQERRRRLNLEIMAHDQSSAVVSLMRKFDDKFNSMTPSERRQFVEAKMNAARN